MSTICQSLHIANKDADVSGAVRHWSVSHVYCIDRIKKLYGADRLFACAVLVSIVCAITSHRVRPYEQERCIT